MAQLEVRPRPDLKSRIGLIEMSLLDCHHCEELGHWAKDCLLLIPPADKAEHEQRFTKIMGRFHEGKISPHGKRRVIEKENALWKWRQKEMAKK